jgi:hypothetical protein
MSRLYDLAMYNLSEEMYRNIRPAGGCGYYEDQACRAKAHMGLGYLDMSTVAREMDRIRAGGKK